MVTRAKFGWIGLGALVACVIAFFNASIGWLLATVLGIWAMFVFKNPARRAIAATALGVPATNRGPQVASAAGEVVLAIVLIVCAVKGSAVRSEREVKEKQRIEQEQSEAERLATQRKDADLRLHAQEAIDTTTKALADAKGGLERGDYSAAQRSLGSAKTIVARYEGLTPRLAPMVALASQVHDSEQDLAVISNVKRSLSDGPGQLAEAAAKIKEKDYVAADKILEDLSSGLDVPERSAAYVSIGEVKKLRGTVESKRKSIAGGLKRQRTEIAAARVYEKLCGDKPLRSGWDGAIVGLERQIKETANDPDSIDVKDCTLPQMTEKHCWVSTCKVRGRNAFNALILLRKTYSFSTLGIEEVQ